MTVDQVIALAASLGACMAAIATFLTVVQISKQRRATYHPELVLSRVFFEGSHDPQKNSSLPSLWTNSDQDPPSHATHTYVSEKTKSDFQIPVANIGLGAAKNVTVQWEFPLEDLVKELNDRAQRTLTPAYFTLKDGAFSAKSEKFGNWTSLWQNQKQVTIDFILPAAIQRDAFLLQLPHAYIVGASSLLVLGFNMEEELEVPSLVAKFEYLDIANDKHESTFEIEFRLIVIINNGQTIRGYLEPRKRV